MPLQEDRATSGSDGSVRKSHYGDGKQPWDTIVEKGWGAQFAAANVIKYLRRAKDPDHSLQSARWYYAQLKAIAGNDSFSATAQLDAAYTYKALLGELTNAELMKLVK